MSATVKTAAAGTSTKKTRTPAVRSVEAVRWTTLRGKMTPQRRRAALRDVAAKMR
jgi:hypothetical protein